MQTTIVLDPFTELNGATAIRPGMKKKILTSMFESRTNYLHFVTFYCPVYFCWLIYLGTQKSAEYPENVDDFMTNMIQPTASEGDVIIFTGVAQHCAMPNRSNKSRTGILIQMLPKV